MSTPCATSFCCSLLFSVRSAYLGTKGKIVGQKAPLNLKEVWAARIRLQLAERARDLALFNLGIDSKLRACDLKLESTVRYLGIEVDDALEMAEQTEV